MKTVLSLVLSLIVSSVFSQDIKLIETEVYKLYDQYTQNRKHIIKPRTELDSLAFCQLMYLETLECVNSITHQNPDSKLKTFSMRVDNYFINTMGEKFSEVISGYWTGNGKYIDEKNVCQILFQGLLKSPPHKKILDDRRFINCSFRVCRINNGGFILIGVFSTNEVFFFREKG
jgi:hypothetical protein